MVWTFFLILWSRFIQNTHKILSIYDRTIVTRPSRKRLGLQSAPIMNMGEINSISRAMWVAAIFSSFPPSRKKWCQSESVSISPSPTVCIN